MVNRCQRNPLDPKFPQHHSILDHSNRLDHNTKANSINRLDRDIKADSTERMDSSA